VRLMLKLLAGAAAAAVAIYVYTRPKKPKSVKLTYFDIRATPGEKTRLALVLSGTPFDDNRVKFPDWAALKPKTKYGQMPILEVDGVEYYQSGSHLRWAGSLGDGSLYPSDPATRMKIEEMLGLGDDIQRAWAPGLYMGMRPEAYGYTKENAPVKALREKFMSEEFGKYMKFLEAELASTGAFVCGAKPTIADCALYPQIEYFTRGVADYVPADCMTPYPLASAWLKRMRALPAIDTYYTKLGF